jgi:hypothetical protein
VPGVKQPREQSLMIHFINVDLEIESHECLQPIADAFGEDVAVLGCGKWGPHYQAAFEASGLNGDADSIIKYFCLLIEALAEEERSLWSRAFLREFNIGYESGLEPRSYESTLRSETVSLIHAIGASIKITIYPPDEVQKQNA